MEATTTGVRRLWALVNGLPADAAVWRPDGWTDRDELLAQIVEVTDMWGRLAAQQRGARPGALPKPVRIVRPGGEQQQKPKVETDARVIAAWFKSNVSGRG